MTQVEAGPPPRDHAHVFLGTRHARNERRAWFVIVLCSAMMAIEIVGGVVYGSIALVADGIHMSTHAGAMLLAALAYTFARRRAHDARFSFGTGKIGDLAGFTSAIVLGVVALLIGVESVARVFRPVAIGFGEAIPIALLGLGVNLASAWLLTGEPHGHDHGHDHGRAHPAALAEPNHHDHEHDHDGDGGDAAQIDFRGGVARLEIFESDGTARFRVTTTPPLHLDADEVSITLRHGDATRTMGFVAGAQGLLSREALPTGDALVAHLTLGRGAGAERFRAEFGASAAEAVAPAHAAHARDNNMRAVLVHVIADAVVSLFVIAGLVLARAFGWRWMDPAAGIAGALVIAVWAVRLMRDTGAILLDFNPDRGLTAELRRAVETEGDAVTDLHLWRLGPGHLGAIVAVDTTSDREAEDYRRRLARFPAVSHLTVEVRRTPA